MQGRGVGPAVPPRLPGASRRPAAHGRHHGLPLSRAGPGCVYCGSRDRCDPGSGSGSGRMFAEGSAPGSHRPRLASARRSPRLVPVVASGGHATPRHGDHHGACRAPIRPDGRRGRTGGRRRSGPRGPGGRPGHGGGGARPRRDARRAEDPVRLRSGARSRTKMFDVDGLSTRDIQQRLGRLTRRLT